MLRRALFFSFRTRAGVNPARLSLSALFILPLYQLPHRFSFLPDGLKMSPSSKTIALCCVLSLFFTVSCFDEEATPEIQVSVLLFRKSNILPHFLDRLQRLKYAKDKLHLWIQCDEVSLWKVGVNFCTYLWVGNKQE